MKIIVCAKEVLDPDAVNNYAVAGRLVIGEDGKTLTQTAIPRLMNGFDEQALEAALRLRDAGADCTIVVVSVGPDPAALLKHAASLGADEIIAIPGDPAMLDHHAVASLLTAYVRSSGGADLLLFGRQASDDDQGVVFALMGEALGMPIVTVARALELAEGSDGPVLRVTRVTPDGDEVVEVSCPAVVTVSNELGDPRYPTAAKKLAARRMKPTVVALEDLALSAEQSQPRATLTRQFVPTIQGNCEFITGDTAAALADHLIERLCEDGAIQ
jgi:electron transfer flavoprotein beta subunit